MQAYTAAFEQYGKQIATTYTPHCAWSYAEGPCWTRRSRPWRAHPGLLHDRSALDHRLPGPMLLDGITVDTTKSDESGSPRSSW